ncbi:MAG: hypothetical protein AVDCRST_MAG13-3032, partial [uncultured Solirubrobacteraceae bacterium]
DGRPGHVRRARALRRHRRRPRGGRALVRGTRRGSRHDARRPRGDGLPRHPAERTRRRAGLLVRPRPGRHPGPVVVHRAHRDDRHRPVPTRPRPGRRLAPGARPGRPHHPDRHARPHALRRSTHARRRALHPPAL